MWVRGNQMCRVSHWCTVLSGSRVHQWQISWYWFRTIGFLNWSSMHGILVDNTYRIGIRSGDVVDISEVSLNQSYKQLYQWSDTTIVYTLPRVGTVLYQSRCPLWSLMSYIYPFIQTWMWILWDFSWIIPWCEFSKLALHGPPVFVPSLFTAWTSFLHFLGVFWL